MIFALPLLLAAGLTPTPVLVELFTSEGCSSCPPADQLLAKLEQMQPVSGAHVIALSEHVDYWNYLGWKDPFSSPEFSRRQQAYARRFAGRGPYTPQMVIDGTTEFVGSDGPRALAAITQSARQPKHELTLTRSANKLQIQSPPLPRGKADLFIALVQKSGEAQVPAGENAGRKLTHVAIVRHLIQAQRATSKEPLDQTMQLPPGAENLQAVAFLQEPNLGKILAIATQ